MINILITGASGQLGSELKEIGILYKKYKFFFTNSNELNITNHSSVSNYVIENKIKVIINCAAYTKVDDAESDVYKCNEVNNLAVSSLANIAEKNEIQLIHISTDYVFDGKSNKPINEFDNTNPISVYGKTKLEGEKSILNSNIEYLIIRTSWLYSSYGNNFVKTIMRLGKEKNEIGIISDQIGSPTYARDLAITILKIIPQLNSFNKGIYHFSNEGVASWYDFSKAIIELLGIECNVLPVESKDFKTLAERPSYSILNKSKIKKMYSIDIPHWRDSLKECLIQIKNND